MKKNTRRQGPVSGKKREKTSLQRGSQKIYAKACPLVKPRGYRKANLSKR